jgi:magnesium transporter
MAAKAVNLQKSIKALLKMGKKQEVKQLLSGLHPADIAELLEETRNDNQQLLFALLDTPKAAEVLEELEPDSQLDLVKRLSQNHIAEILNNMSVDELIDILREFPPDQVSRLLKAIPSEDIAVIEKLMALDEDTAGGIMTTDYVYIPEDTTVAQAIDMVRKFGQEAETIYYLYIVDKDHRLAGVLSLRELISAKRSLTVKKIMRSPVITVDVEEDKEEVAKVIEKYSLLAVPVIGPSRRLLGIVTVDDALEVLDDEVTEDIHRFAGVTAEEEDTLTVSPLGAVRHRLPWLIITLFGGIIAGSIMNRFTATLEAALAIAFFIPVLNATGGNVGTQSLALAVRGIATREINKYNFISYIFRETTAGMLVGIVCGIIMALVVMVWQGNTTLSMVVGIAMAIALTIAAMVGMVIPIVLNMLKVDPAVASGPFITTLTDVNTVIIYLSISTMFLNGLK